MVDVGLLILKVLASIFSLGMIFSPSLDLRKVVKSQSTGEMALLPLVSLWISSHLWTVYGLLTDDMFPLFATYLIGEICGIVYTAIFYRYTTEKAYARKVILSALAFFIIITGYIIVAKAGVTDQSSHSVEQIVGYITTITGIALYTSPLETIARVLKTKSGASIPVLMCLCGCGCNTLWMIYGLIDNDTFVFLPAAFCAFFATLQIVLYFVFYPKRASNKGEVLDGAPKSDLPITVSTVVAADEVIVSISDAKDPHYEAMHSPRPSSNIA
uniref:Bidirectional sugar transporter SWEET n=1 Tax=Globisporangium ultimum (strain ATCC 200006 / CBS 805.95 / DAOM BR144) TaxID=431595 RepID=K3WEX8_GLOUD